MGEVYRVRDGSMEKLFTFSDAAGRPYRWQKTPKGIVRWHSEWLVCDNSTRLLHFNSRGGFVRGTEAPVRAAGLTVAGDQLIIHNLVASTPAEQFWSSADGVKVTRIPLSEKNRFRSPLENLLIIAGGGRGEIFSVPVIGPPVIRVVLSERSQREISAQYSRTAFRAGLDQPEGFVDDIGPYSQPVRDLYPLTDGQVVALRNREDVRSVSGKKEMMVGRRADRYDRVGKHQATAEFPSTVRWVIAVTENTVTALTRTGEISTVTWGKPKPGEILN